MSRGLLSFVVYGLISVAGATCVMIKEERERRGRETETLMMVLKHDNMLLFKRHYPIIVSLNYNFQIISLAHTVELLSFPICA